MGTTLTLKNMPDEVVQRLRTSAALNRRSMNSEAIVLLESALMAGASMPVERLARARALREALALKKFKARDIEAMKREGRS